MTLFHAQNKKCYKEVHDIVFLVRSFPSSVQYCSQLNYIRPSKYTEDRCTNKNMTRTILFTLIDLIFGYFPNLVQYLG